MNGRATVLGFLVILLFGALMLLDKVGQYVGFGAMLVGVGVMFPARLKQIVTSVAKLNPFGKGGGK